MWFLCKKVPVFKPSSIYKLVWDFIMICAISFLLFMIPIHISFGMPYDMFTHKALVDVACSMIFIDIGVSINTGFYDKGIHVTDRLQIVKHYVKTSLVTEILGCLSLIAHFFSWEGYIQQFVLMLFISKVNHFSNIAARLQERFLLSPTIQNRLKLVKLLITNILISHFYACIWIYIAYQQNMAGKSSWLDSKGLIGTQWFIQYCQSYYFITVLNFHLLIY